MRSGEIRRGAFLKVGRFLDSAEPVAGRKRRARLSSRAMGHSMSKRGLAYAADGSEDSAPPSDETSSSKSPLPADGRDQTITMVRSVPLQWYGVYHYNGLLRTMVRVYPSPRSTAFVSEVSGGGS